MYEITVKRGETIIAEAWGDLDAMAYHVRRLELDGSTEYEASLIEAEAIGHPASGTLASITADGDIVKMVLGKKLRAARAERAVPAEAAEPAE